jgi:hypothetical protein
MGQSASTKHLGDAEQIARAHNMFVVLKGEHYLLYRRTRTRPVFLGSRGDVPGIRSLISRCAASK